MEKMAKYERRQVEPTVAIPKGLRIDKLVVYRIVFVQVLFVSDKTTND